ncbi:MAG: ABC transporter permease [Planctomycetota bacterium]|jgi:simple sugar transport system permease protein|nr:ABC transporter permease [Planctomycetota bacterium]
MPETLSEPVRRPGFFGRDKNFTRLLAIFVLVFIGCAILKPDLFLKASNFQSMAKQFPEFGLLSIGVALTMLTGGIDLSVVNIGNLAAVLAARVMISFAPKGSSPEQTLTVVVAAMVLALFVGALCGAVNGLLVSKIGIPAILATLGTQQLFMGLAIVVTSGRPISGLPMIYARYGNRNIFGAVPVVLAVFAVSALIVGVLLSRTRFGAKLYMLGSNATAARFAGINVDRLYVLAYMLSGLLAAVAGLIMMARSNSAKADYGISYTMQSILIAVLGGVSPNGGRGNVQGVVAAVLILQLLSSVLNMFENISNFYRDILWGIVMIGVLIINYLINVRDLRRQSQ